jgi:hypothetical protein
MPAWGRFISEDPIGLVGGINLYAYAKGQPVNLTDPRGLFPGQIGRPGSGGSCDQGPQNPEVTPVGFWNTIRAWCFYLACLAGGEEPPEVTPPPPPPIEHKAEPPKKR